MATNYRAFWKLDQLDKQIQSPRAPHSMAYYNSIAYSAEIHQPSIFSTDEELI